MGTLLVRGRETYELLKRIRDSIELSKMASSDQLDRLQAMDAEMEQQVNAASSLISLEDGVERPAGPTSGYGRGNGAASECRLQSNLFHVTTARDWIRPN